MIIVLVDKLSSWDAKYVKFRSNKLSQDEMEIWRNFSSRVQRVTRDFSNVTGGDSRWQAACRPAGRFLLGSAAISIKARDVERNR